MDEFGSPWPYAPQKDPSAAAAEVAWDGGAVHQPAEGVIDFVMPCSPDVGSEEGRYLEGGPWLHRTVGAAAKAALCSGGAPPPWSRRRSS
uniref:Uncharacterized protein n=1 Tax=Arundo donax TaxID=35708 RepID=A0A0A9HB68_ARUDO